MNNTVASFTDISQHWAYPFIRPLQRQGVVSGFEDRTFRPDQTMTRAEFAAIIQAAFSLAPRRDYIPFTDVPANFWAAEAIRNTFRAGFISGFPDGRFLPGQNISRLHVLLALVSGLQMQAGASVSLAAIYNDGGNIPDYAQQAIATATQSRLVVNAPTIDIFNPNRPATRGEVAACIYQARVFLKQNPIVASPHIVELANPGVIRRGTHLSVNGRTWRAAWGQWSSGICTYTGVSDKGAILVLGMELLNTDDVNLQPVKWFSTIGKSYRLKTKLDREYRYLNLDDIAPVGNWEMVIDNQTLRIFSVPTKIDDITVNENQDICRIEIQLSKATPWELYEQSREWEVVLDAIADQSLAARFPETPTPPPKSGNQEQQNEGETSGSSEKPSPIVVRISATQTVIKGTLPDGYRVRTQTLNNRDRLVIELRRDALVEHSISVYPGLRSRQQYLTLEGDKFPAVWLTITPRSGLSIAAIWTEKNQMRGTNSLLSIAQTWSSLGGINGGYFNRNNLLPLGAIRKDNKWFSGPILNRGAMAWDNTGRVRMGRLKLVETIVTSTGQRFEVDLLNTGYVKAGIARYTSEWGANYLPLTLNEIVVVVSGDQVTRQIELPDDQTPTAIPTNGYLLVFRSFRSAVSAFGVGSRLTITAATTPPEFIDFPNIMGGGPLLVQNRNIVVNAEAEGFNYWFGQQLAIRSAVGVTATGELLMVTVHNRVNGAGPSLTEMAKLMQQLGAIDAINLDGGSSTSLVLGGHLLNRTPDTAARVHNGLGIFI
ncbi:phosphodiester glycosidase family protein [Arthrospira platensis]|jgi:hypothetical protein|uniref:SLH domain-containing protein n=1 Tax=Limnospira platensis NIES-46 TaxID=1236695 RepID=A0A5M3TEC5_LIMPL|nr:phosphodiester glycosidase family protein [Arthrospira platensis]MBD2710903.1 phosphodiester glycosidase family protein [Arthrospira platensis FACHB-835]MDF2210904.1 phosphodiester glycosidase family protein [Arthrospira platensis NCB002]MDT9183396.1 phosphodiester glycosidase family protein [Limnospira sp. PMC 289.06]MDT9295369.1 phosphodiester glycosidase family protein [Arthrospira platensis PCC 7345]QQW30751.1 phosphodiester glycosidase family protein [Arthrospira sp. PCC 9108]BAI89700